MNINLELNQKLDQLARSARNTYCPGEYEERWLPTGERNTHKARCNRCKKTLHRDEGIQWYRAPENTEQPYSPLDIFYYCTDCHSFYQALKPLKPRIYTSMQRIEAWCEKQGMLAGCYFLSGRIEKLIFATGLRAADISELIADRLPELDRSGATTWEIEAFARAIIDEAMVDNDCIIYECNYALCEEAVQ